LRIRDQETIRNPVPYLYTVASNLVKDHAVLDARRAAGVNIDEASHQEQLEVLPSFEATGSSTMRRPLIAVPRAMTARACSATLA
jgi:hypothetical protein